MIRFRQEQRQLQSGLLQTNLPAFAEEAAAERVEQEFPVRKRISRLALLLNSPNEISGVAANVFAVEHMDHPKLLNGRVTETRKR